MRVSSLALAILALWSTISAAEPRVRGFAEAGFGASVPLADDNYRKLAAASFKASLRGGLELTLSRWVKLAPELQIDLIPVMTNNSSYAPTPLTPSGIQTSFQRYRFLGGLRLLFDFGFGSAMVRFLVGADYLSGSEGLSAVDQFTGEVLHFNYNYSSEGRLTVQPGVGVQFRFLKYGIAGVSLDVPIAFHDFGLTWDRRYVLFDAAGVNRFTAVDLDLLATIGFRYPK